MQGKDTINMDDAAGAASPAIGTALPWPRIWLVAVARPNVATFQGLARHPRVGSWDAWIWLVASSFFSGLLVSLSSLLLRARSPFDLALPLVVFTIFSILTWMLFTVCIQLISRAFKGQGEYRTLLYSFAAFNAPLILLASGLSFVPHSRPGLFLLYLYWLALYSVAVRVAHRLSWMRAFGAVLLSLMLLSATLLGSGWLIVAWII